MEIFLNVNNYRTHKLNKMELSSATNANTGRDPAASEQRTALIEGTYSLNFNLHTTRGECCQPKRGGGAPYEITSRLDVWQETLDASCPRETFNENGLMAYTELEQANLFSGQRNKIIQTKYEQSISGQTIGSACITIQGVSNGKNFCRQCPV